VKKGTDRKLTTAAVNRPLALLRAVLRLATEEGHLREAPRIKLPKEPEGRVRWLSPEEARRLLDACRASRNPELVDYVELSLFTGMRQGEVLELEWTRVDRARGVIELTAEGTKGKRRRTVPLNERADAVLERRAKAGTEAYVFSSQSWDTFRTAWEFAWRRAAITPSERTEGFRPHDLRHTFASWSIQSGKATLPELKELLGHATLAMTMRYAHLAPENLRKASAALDGILDTPPANVAHGVAHRRERAPR
jgi:integrase